MKPLRAFGAGPGLMWAAACAFVIWMAACGAAIAIGPRAATDASVMMDLVRERFPLLVAIVLTSLPLGFAAGCIRRTAGTGGVRFSVARAVCAGGFAGIAGGWAFGKWMEQAGFFPLVAGLVRSDSAMVGVALHFAIAVVIGATFGLLFQREIRGLGSSLAWGAAYGILWYGSGFSSAPTRLTGRSKGRACRRCRHSRAAPLQALSAGCSSAS